jgi:hypothetical protein
MLTVSLSKRTGVLINNDPCAFEWKEKKKPKPKPHHRQGHEHAAQGQRRHALVVVGAVRGGAE